MLDTMGSLFSSSMPSIYFILFYRFKDRRLKLFIETLFEECDVKSIEVRWGELARHNPFIHPLWSMAWWECYRTQDMQLRLMVVRNSAGELVGLAPFYLRTSPILGRELRFLGDGTICSEYLSILAEPGMESEVATAIADYLHQTGQSERSGTWDLIDLDCFQHGDQAISLLRDYLSERGHACHVDEVMGCWRVDFSEGWEAYLAKMSKSRRSKSRRLLKQVVGGEPYQVKWVQRQAEIEEFINNLARLHQARWEGRGELGCFADPRFGKFMRQVASRAIQNDMAHFLQLSYQGQPVSMQLGLRSASTIFSYLVGVDTTLNVDSPGTTMNAFLIHDGVSRGLTSLDFLRGDEPYKHNLRAERVSTERLHVFARYPLAHLRYRCWRTACEMKRLAKDWLKPKPKTALTIEQEA